MSPSWNSNRIRLHLAAGQLAACEVQGSGRSRQIMRKACFAVAPGERSAALRALAEWMAPVVRRAHVEWVLGTSEVRYLLLSWTPDLADAGFRERYARALFEQQFRKDPSPYAVCFAREVYGHAQLAAFVSHALLGEIHAHAKEIGKARVRIEPGLATVWDRFLPMLEKERGVLCLIDGDRQVMVHHDHARISEVVLRPFSADDLETQLPPQAGNDVLRIFSSLPFMDSSLYPGAQLVLSEGQGFSAARDATYAFALCGAI